MPPHMLNFFKLKTLLFEIFISKFFVT